MDTKQHIPFTLELVRLYEARGVTPERIMEKLAELEGEVRGEGSRQ